MLGMTNSQHYWPGFCTAIERPELIDDHRFADQEARAENSTALVALLEDVFRSKTYDQWGEILSRNKLIWAPLQTPLEVTRDEQAMANDYFVEWDHPTYGDIKMLNNPIKLSKTAAENRSKAPDLGEHTEQILEDLGYDKEMISRLKDEGIV